MGSTVSDMAYLGSEAQIDFDRHAGLENALAVVDGDLDAVDELGALVRRLHVARRELGLRRDERDAAFEPIAGVGDDGGGLIERDVRHERLFDVDTGPRVIEIDDDRERRADGDQFAGLDEARSHDPADRRLDDGLRPVVFDRGDLRARWH